MALVLLMHRGLRMDSTRHFSEGWRPVMQKIRHALLSVSDKSGLIALAQVLEAAGIEVISTGGTARTLREAGIKGPDFNGYTRFPEILGWRGKTLHPKVHGGQLYMVRNPRQ